MAMTVMIVVMIMNIYLEIQDKCINDLSTSAARVIIKYDEVDDNSKSIKKLSKSCQKMKELSKSPKASRV